jgi:hypothetical protein
MIVLLVAGTLRAQLCIGRGGQQSNGRSEMKKLAASLLVVGLASTAFAAEAAKFYVVKDTVGLCSVVEGEPSAGLTPIAEKGGYESRDAGKKALKEVSEKAGCKGVVE